MRLFLDETIWKTKRGFTFDKAASYLAIGIHGGQDFFTLPVGSIPVYAPCDGELITFPGFSKSAGWWGVYRFQCNNATYSLKILHMYKELKAGKYKEGDILGYCGGTGLAVTGKYGTSYIGESHEEQTSDRAVPHLHAELHIGEYKHDTNKNKLLAQQRLIDPVKTFEKWLSETLTTQNNMTFYKEKDKSSVYIKGADNIYYPIITGKHFLTLFGDWKDNKINEVDSLEPKSDIYFGLFKSQDDGKYDIA
ncbi:MAG: M23 family metallopeptidase [Patescibacteria group bacterium]|jgi:murein DD-endopeptidase MepM/ murein hydrolase activator NlpD